LTRTTFFSRLNPRKRMKTSVFGNRAIGELGMSWLP